MKDNIPQDSINLSFTVDDYIDSSSAEVTVNIDASLDDDGVELKNTIVQDLEKITSGVTWRFSNVNRTKDRTGRENWYVEAKARLTDGDLAVISKKCKDQGKTGLQYRVSSVDYTPTRNEFEVARRSLRQKLNELVVQELDALNDELDRNNWRVSHIHFHEDIQGHQPLVYNNYMVKGMAMAASASSPSDFNTGTDVGDESAAESSTGFEISQKMTMTANVVISSFPAIP